MAGKSGAGEQNWVITGAYHCWLASEAKQGWFWSVPGWETRCCWKWSWRVSRRHSFLWSKKCPRAVIGDTALYRVPSFGWDVKLVS